MKVCGYCGDADDSHDSLCPVPIVQAPGAGVATSDWVDALLIQMKKDGTKLGPKSRDLITRSWVMQHRFAENAGNAKGATAVMEKLVSNARLAVVDAPLVDALIADAASVPAEVLAEVSVATILEAAVAEVLADAPKVGAL